MHILHTVSKFHSVSFLPSFASTRLGGFEWHGDFTEQDPAVFSDCDGRPLALDKVLACFRVIAWGYEDDGGKVQIVVVVPTYGGVE